MATATGPHITTKGLVAALDTNSHRSKTTSTRIDNIVGGIQGVNSGTVQGAISVGHQIVQMQSFDGTDDFLELSSPITMSPVGFTVIMIIDIDDSQSSSGWNYWFLQTANDGHKYEFGQYGTTGNRFHFKDNFNQTDSGITANLPDGFSMFAFGSTEGGVNGQAANYSYYSINAAAKTYSSGNGGWAGGDDISMSIFFKGGSSSFFGANIINMLIYNRELRTEELLNTYNSFKTRYNL